MQLRLMNPGPLDVGVKLSILSASEAVKCFAVESEIWIVPRYSSETVTIDFCPNVLGKAEATFEIRVGDGDDTEPLFTCHFVGYGNLPLIQIQANKTIDSED